MKWKTIALLASFLLFLFSACRDNAGSGEKTARQEPPALTPEEQEAYLKKGAEVTGATFAALSGTLREALQREGVAGAVKYCNLAAYPLVDSLSRMYDADIRRTSLRVRNPKDKPTEAELAVLKAYHANREAGAPLLPGVERAGSSSVAFYAPILIQEACLQCHGKLGETLLEEDYAVIRELYPGDEATGYQAGDLRGMWSVTFRR
ncbi:MAG: DUF3365 domain-containing protein [Phaeodactylibacter sp.]|nr:DUF3365 domain-containing protein [Phaeodactylibacter sp.]